MTLLFMTALLGFLWLSMMAYYIHSTVLKPVRTGKK
jgi:hypothetical protein